MRLRIPVRSSRSAVSSGVVAVVVILILVLAGAAVYLGGFLGGPSSSTSSSSSSSSGSSTSSTSSSTQTSSTTSAASSPQSITYETLQTVQYLDPLVSYDIYGASIEQNIYEPLFYFNGTNALDAIPWLAQNYTLSSDGKTMTITLRSGIHFADGETLNSSAVYFSYNRLLVFDGSSPSSLGTQASWIVQQLVNESLSTTLCACSHVSGVSGAVPPFYGSAYTNAVLGEHFVEVTGPLTLTLHIMNPQAAVLYILSNLWANILAHDWVMQHDVQLWGAATSSYHLPYPTLSGNSTQMFHQYYDDFTATCSSRGCAATYLESSPQGSMAGTGPYTIQSVDYPNVVVMKANPGYWGGPFGKIHAHIAMVTIKYVPDLTTRKSTSRTPQPRPARPW
jgi:ABC-type transport system substrate-binding protein